MNLFWLDSDPTLAAQAHQDIHVGKMLLEAVQLLCTAFEEPSDPLPTAAFVTWQQSTPTERLAADLLPYAHTHRNHPCAVWVRATRGNFDAAISLAQALAAEFRYRFDKPHASEAALDWVVRHRAEAPALEAATAHMTLSEFIRRCVEVFDGPLTPFALAMPEKYQIERIRVPVTGCLAHVEAYRAYYRAEKRGHWRASPHSERQDWIPAKWTRRNPPEWF